ncbi:hypothetical protein V8C44DRAFT_341787 [Trichoderma aethiopicum]
MIRLRPVKYGTMLRLSIASFRPIWAQAGSLVQWTDPKTMDIFILLSPLLISENGALHTVRPTQALIITSRGKPITNVTTSTV